jgi:hypothetical protein
MRADPRGMWLPMKFLFDLFELLPVVPIAEVANKCEREIPPRVGPRAGVLSPFLWHASWCRRPREGRGAQGPDSRTGSSRLGSVFAVASVPWAGRSTQSRARPRRRGNRRHGTRSRARRGMRSDRPIARWLGRDPRRSPSETLAGNCRCRRRDNPRPPARPGCRCSSRSAPGSLMRPGNGRSRYGLTPPQAARTFMLVSGGRINLPPLRSGPGARTSGSQ